jgi:hypothetical protein
MKCGISAEEGALYPRILVEDSRGKIFGIEATIEAWC